MCEKKLQKLREAMLSEIKSFEVQVNRIKSAVIPNESDESMLAMDGDTDTLGSKIHVSENGYVSNTESPAAS